MVPIAQDTQAFEVGALLVNLLGGVGTAFGLHVVARDVAAMQFFNGVFNRQTMAIPTGYVGRVQPLQLACFDDHVFENLVGSVANVDLAVGIRRAVVQYKFGCVHAGVTQFFVNAFVLPRFHPERLALGQVTTHGEGGIW